MMRLGPTRALSPPVRAALGELRVRLERRFGPRLRGMTLFGSLARGEARAESDVDVLVLVDDLTNRERRVIFEEGADVWMDTGIHLAPLALSVAEWDGQVRLRRMLVDEVKRDGIPI